MAFQPVTFDGSASLERCTLLYALHAILQAATCFFMEMRLHPVSSDFTQLQKDIQSGFVA